MQIRYIFVYVRFYMDSMNTYLYRKWRFLIKVRIIALRNDKGNVAKFTPRWGKFVYPPPLFFLSSERFRITAVFFEYSWSSLKIVHFYISFTRYCGYLCEQYIRNGDVFLKAIIKFIYDTLLLAIIVIACQIIIVQANRRCLTFITQYFNYYANK